MVLAYSSYRFYITRAAGSDYKAISELRGYEQRQGAGLDIFQGGSYSASSTQGSYVPSNAFDGNNNTTWESTSSKSPAWLRIDLAGGVPKVLRSFSLEHFTWLNELPSDFVIEGSNDGGVTWTPIAGITEFDKKTTTTGGLYNIGIILAGRATLQDTGQRAVRVLIHDWLDASFVVQVIPDSDGFWMYRPSLYRDVLVTYIGPAGYRPLSFGPITPFDEM